MPDMRDAIAQYLAYSGQQMPQGGSFQAPPGGGPGMMMGPRAGIPSNLQGYPQLPSGQFLPTPISDTGPFPGVPQMPPSPDYTGPQPTQMPPGPPLPRPGTPDADFTGSPPINTPMQAPPNPVNMFDPSMQPLPQRGPGDIPAMGGPQVAGMDPAEWYRMYSGGR